MLISITNRLGHFLLCCTLFIVFLGPFKGPFLEASDQSFSRVDSIAVDSVTKDSVQMRFYVDPPAIHRGETVWILAEITIPKGHFLHWRASDRDYEHSDLSVELPPFLRLNRIIWPPPQLIGSIYSVKEPSLGYQGRLYILIETSFHYDEVLRITERQMTAEIEAKWVLSSLDGQKSLMRKKQRIHLPRVLLPNDVPPPVDVVNQSLFGYARSLLPIVLPSSRFHVNWAYERPLLTIWGREGPASVVRQESLPSQEFSPYMQSEKEQSSTRELQKRWFIVLVESFDPSIFDSSLHEEGLMQNKSAPSDGVKLWRKEKKKVPRLFVEEVQLLSSDTARYERFMMRQSVKERLKELNPSKLYLISEDGYEVYQINLEPPQSSFVKAISSVNLYHITKRYWKMLTNRLHLF